MNLCEKLSSTKTLESFLYILPNRRLFILQFEIKTTEHRNVCVGDLIFVELLTFILNHGMIIHTNHTKEKEI